MAQRLEKEEYAGIAQEQRAVSSLGEGYHGCEVEDQGVANPSAEPRSTPRLLYRQPTPSLRQATLR